MKAASSAVLIHLFHSVPDVSILRDSRRWSGPVGGLRSRIITFEDLSDRVDLTSYEVARPRAPGCALNQASGNSSLSAVARCVGNRSRTSLR